jgi:hypothetical protein
MQVVELVSHLLRKHECKVGTKVGSIVGIGEGAVVGAGDGDCEG